MYSAEAHTTLIRHEENVLVQKLSVISLASLAKQNTENQNCEMVNHKVRCRAIHQLPNLYYDGV